MSAGGLSTAVSHLQYKRVALTRLPPFSLCPREKVADSVSRHLTPAWIATLPPVIDCCMAPNCWYNRMVAAKSNQKYTPHASTSLLIHRLIDSYTQAEERCPTDGGDSGVDPPHSLPLCPLLYLACLNQPKTLIASKVHDGQRHVNRTCRRLEGNVEVVLV
jgi:hypothetical protein